MDLSWTDNSSSEDGFRIERCTGAGCTSFVEIFAADARTSTTYSDTGPHARRRSIGIACWLSTQEADSAYSNIAEATTPRTAAAAAGRSEWPDGDAEFAYSGRSELVGQFEQ